MTVMWVEPKIRLGQNYISTEFWWYPTFHWRSQNTEDVTNTHVNMESAPLTVFVLFFIEMTQGAVGNRLRIVPAVSVVCN
jgi:hypothetical protein